MTGKIVCGQRFVEYYVHDNFIEQIEFVGTDRHIKLSIEFPDAVNGSFYKDKYYDKRYLYFNNQWYCCLSLSNGLHSFRYDGTILTGPVWIQNDDKRYSNLQDVISDLRTQINELKYAPSRVGTLEKEFKSGD